MMVKNASVDGVIMDADGATVPATDEGLTRGDGAFEMIHIYDGHPFTLDQHIERLVHSCNQLDLPIDTKKVRSEIEALLAEHGREEAALRVVLTRGGHRILTLEKLPLIADSARLNTVTYSPNLLLQGVKSLSYGANMLATRRAIKEGFDEALLVTPDGTVLEAPTSCIFWTTEAGKLKTPSLDTGILDSITRRVIVNALDVDQGHFKLDDLMRAEEAFLASTIREAQPVSLIDDQKLDWPGPLTQRAREALRTAVENEQGA